jgi:predicted unusual protein kinase regulating ubiquinone biosynthesis (AarF/ABC1/UbiB family)
MAAKDKGKGQLAKGRTKRVLKVGGLAGTVGGSYLWEALRSPFRPRGDRQKALLDTHIRNAMRIVEGSKELKGAFMKLVQMLSMRDDILPPEALSVLSVVQSQVPPMKYREIRQQLVDELGGDPEKLFATFEHDAFAAASLGQVHRATLHSGETVVVKVQYPGVEETVEQDLRNVKALLNTFTLIGRDVMRQEIDQSEVYQELEERLNEELDYVNEARNARRFRKMFADDDEVLIPEVYPKLSSRRVLTMSYLEGYSLSDILKPGVDQSLKDWVALKYFRVLWRQVFEFGVLHTDPHPGNYLVTYHPKLGILDFGSIRVFPPEIRRAYHGLAAGILDGDDDAVADCLVRLGFMNADDDPKPLLRIMRIIFGPVLVDEEYDPRDYDSMERAMKITQIGFEHRIFKAPGHRVFLGRALIGLDSYLKQLGTVTNYHRLFRECVEAVPR